MGDMQRLIADIRQRRGTDTVVAFEPATGLGSVEPAALDEFAERVGLSGIGDQWREVSREAAVSLAAAALTQDLAYDSVQKMPPAEARELAERFAEAFSPDARYFTNTDYAVGTDYAVHVSSLGFMPLTESTFDTGVLGVDAYRIGILVVQDED